MATLYIKSIEANTQPAGNIAVNIILSKGLTDESNSYLEANITISPDIQGDNLAAFRWGRAWIEYAP